MPTAAEFNAYHEAGHAVAALLRGVGVRHVGLVHGDPDQSGVCAFDTATRPDTAALLGDMMVIAAAGPVAATLAGQKDDPTGRADAGDFAALTVFEREARKLAPPGWQPPAPVSAARAELSCPVAWAGVVTLARAIVRCNGMIDGPTAVATIKTGFRDRGLVDVILMNGTRAAV